MVLGKCHPILVWWWALIGNLTTGCRDVGRSVTNVLQVVFIQSHDQVVVSNIFYFYPYLGKWSNLTNIFHRGWNHHLDDNYITCPLAKRWWNLLSFSIGWLLPKCTSTGPGVNNTEGWFSNMKPFQNQHPFLGGLNRGMLRTDSLLKLLPPMFSRYGNYFILTKSWGCKCHRFDCSNTTSCSLQDG